PPGQKRRGRRQPPSALRGPSASTCVIPRPVRERTSRAFRVSTMRLLRWGILSVSVLVVAAIGAAALGLARGYATPFPGFLVYRSGGVTSLGRAGWPGRRAGLRVRDVVIAVDGEPVRGGAQLARALERRWSQERITVQVQEPESRMLPGGLGAVRSVELP